MKLLLLILSLYTLNNLCSDIYWVDQYPIPAPTTTQQEDPEE